MASLISIPIEMLLRVLHYLHPDPEDLENFAATCSLFNKVAAPQMHEHRLLKKKYGRLIFSKDGNDSVQTVLLEVLGDSRIAYYIKDVKVNDLRPTRNYHRVDLRTLPQVMSPEQVKLVFAVLRNSTLIPTPQCELWIVRISIGIQTTMSALLLPMLPNLHTLNTGEYLGLRELRTVVENMAAEYNNTGQCPQAFGKLSIANLRQLTGRRRYPENSWFFHTFPYLRSMTKSS
ncbi:hypothetical protein MMC12_001090 [Toensbergia leucococca]|nr:hypothetical protein [Toensbergia leucococca]